MAIKTPSNEIKDDGTGVFNGVDIGGSYWSVGASTGIQSQGSDYGYSSGGSTPYPPGAYSNTIDRFPFASNSNATDVGNLNLARDTSAGQSSATHGYSCGSPAASALQIDKFPFSSATTNATDIADLSVARSMQSGQSSTTHGYNSGGFSPGIPGRSNTIDKFPFSADADATDVGDLVAVVNFASGQSSSENGYNSAGYVGFPSYVQTNVIEKYPFATNSNSTDIGDLTQARAMPAGQSSSTHGYVSGGRIPNDFYDTIDKFSFATDANATDVGDTGSTASGTYRAAGQSSITHGYLSGGGPPSSQGLSIDKFPFSVDVGSTNVGDLTQRRLGPAGQQV